MSKDTESAIAEFQQVVNMTAKELKSWLETEKSKAVGQKKENESIGHQSGRKIIEILQKKESQYTEDDISHMKKVISYVRRHSAQRPSHDIETSHWRYSLKNWGHDPVKEHRLN
jgi:DNA topoisomerase VI subunit B